MKIIRDAIILEGHEDRQLIYDAMYTRFDYGQQIANSQYVSADCFKEEIKRSEEALVSMRAAWPDLLH